MIDKYLEGMKLEKAEVSAVFTDEGITQISMGGFGIGLLLIIYHVIEHLAEGSGQTFDSIIKALTDLHAIDKEEYDA